METIVNLFRLILVLGTLVLISAPGLLSWNKEGHALTCQIAQDLLDPEPARFVKSLLPEYVNGNLSALCTWPDQIRKLDNYRWSGELHFADTPDYVCGYQYSRDCHDRYGVEGRCVDGAIQNFTSQLLHFKQGTDSQHNMTEALLFLSHYLGDIHQPMHCGFIGDAGGNTIKVSWFGQKSDLHHVWDRDIVLTALEDYYDLNMDLLLEDLQNNITHGIWSDDVSSWINCNDLLSCPHTYATESVQDACKWGYNGVTSGETLSEEYFRSRMPVALKRIAQGGVRLAMILNRVLGDPQDDAAATATTASA